MNLFFFIWLCLPMKRDSPPQATQCRAFFFGNPALQALEHIGFSGEFWIVLRSSAKEDWQNRTIQIYIHCIYYIIYIAIYSDSQCACLHQLLPQTIHFEPPLFKRLSLTGRVLDSHPGCWHISSSCQRFWLFQFVALLKASQMATLTLCNSLNLSILSIMYSYVQLLYNCQAIAYCHTIVSQSVALAPWSSRSVLLFLDLQVTPTCDARHDDCESDLGID